MLVCREVDADVLCKFYEKQMRRTERQRDREKKYFCSWNVEYVYRWYCCYFHVKFENGTLLTRTKHTPTSNARLCTLQI